MAKRLVESPKHRFIRVLFQGTTDQFLSLVHNTLHSYHDHKLRVNAFQLGLLKLDCASISLLEKSIPILVHMGVENFHLKVYKSSKYKLLPWAIFDVESLVELSLNGCRLNRACGKVILLKHLKVLKLSKVYIEQRTFRRIISRCPLMEEMTLKCCEGLRRIKVNDLQNLKKLYFVDSCDLRIDDDRRGVTNLELVNISRCANWFQLHKFKEFSNLKYLVLTKVSLSGISSYDFSCYFHCLEYLTLDDCYGFEEIQILSHSIKLIGLTVTDKSIKCHIDAPNIRTFAYSGNIPSIISFAKTYIKWTSDINLNLDGDSSLVWSKLNEMLKELRQSTICLDIFKPASCQQNNVVEHFKPVEVESVILNSDDNHSLPIVSKLFGVCCPKNVEVYWYGYEDSEKKRGSNEFAEYVCKTIMNREIENREYLKDVSVNLYDETRHEWRPLRVTSLRECALPKDVFRKQIRFQLQWTEDHVL